MRDDSILRDNRAVEGMPVRLVVAVAVGAVALGVLTPMLDGLESTEPTPVTIDAEPQEVVLDSETETVTVRVVTDDGQPVTDASILVSGRSLPVSDGPLRFETGPDSSEVTITIGETADADVTVDFRRPQTRGSVELRVRPPPDSAYTRAGTEPEITVSKPESK